MKNIVTTASLLLASSLALVIGCTSPQAPWFGKGPVESEPEVAEAERLFEQGYLRSFIVASVAPSTNAAVNAGLQDLQSRIARRLSPEVLEAERLFENNRRQEALAACTALAEKRPDAVGLAQLRARMTRDLAPAVAAAEELFAAGKTQEAISACIDITRKDPEAVGLADLQRRINLRLAEERLAAANKKAEATVDLSSADALGFASMPQRYRQRQHVMGETNVIVTPLTEMQKALQQPVSLTLENADVNAIIAEIKKSTNINYIADSEIVSTKKITARFDNTPLIEMLEYFDKNLDISFSVYSNLVWITQKEPPAAGIPPMKTRVYRLRKGLVGSELGKSAQGASLFKGPEERGSGGSNSQQQEQQPGAEPKVGLLEAIERFVPQPEGADFIFNDKVHALVVKNTLDNLALVEELVAAMDLRPLQVLIEARFVTTSISDMRELGVEWLFQRPVTTTLSDGGTAIAALRAKQMKEETSAEDIIALESQIKDLQEKKLQGTSFLNGSRMGSSATGQAYFQYLLGNTALETTLKALEESGESRMIVVPRVTTLNNREARFRVGEDTSYFEEVETDIMTSGGYNNNDSRDNVTYDYDRPTIVETGYSLVVTPSVGADLSTITMVLRPEISSIKEWKKYRLSSLDSADSVENEPAIEIPILSRQYIETEAVVRSGETVVLGGLVDTSAKDKDSGIPWLSKLPFIGNLFGTKTNEKKINNILIFVTATLISDIGEELIPINDFERYGLAVPAGARVPDILKAPNPQ
ncbi:MAG: Type II secretion system protein D precursor [Verrucomicrobia bacterium ADurb.Bin122]|nr:MAG: Type II secretion system protein D precursor [Verrucomicrobia bacterium ADurb.Bin122]